MANSYCLNSKFQKSQKVTTSRDAKSSREKILPIPHYLNYGSIL